MKLYISVDMEGMAGICHPRQESDDQIRFRKNMQQQVEWVIEGIQKSKRNSEIEEIVIADSHGGGRNLSYDLCDLDDRIALISGTPRPQYMMPSMDSSYDLVFLVGYHSGVGEASANMDHSYGGRTFHDVHINGKYMNESTINSAYAGYHGVPVGLVIGDSALQKQLITDGMMPWVEFVKTKDSLSMMSAKFRPKGVLRQETIEAVIKVLDGDYTSLPVYKIDAPYTLRIEFNMRTMFDFAMLLPGAKAVDGRTIEIHFDDYEELFNGVMAVCYIVGMAYPFDALRR